MLDVPAVVRRNATVGGAATWLDGLDALVDELSARWSLSVGATLPDATEAYVAAAALADGTPCVLKVLISRPGDAARREIELLAHANGEGCARLLRSDVGLGALVVERLGPALSTLSLPMAERHEILCATAQRLWRHEPSCSLPTGREHAEHLAALVATTWEALGRPCSERAIDDAQRCAARRAAAHDDERAVLVHGDVHQWNTLVAGETFKLVDPDGYVAEAECDLGVLMREDPVELMDGDPFDRARWLARRCGLDAQAIWEWGVVERVATGLTCTQIGLQPFGRQMLAVADRVAA